MSRYQDLKAAAAADKDEWYTVMNVIVEELKYYTDYFKDAVILCNCDDPYESNFFKYFAMNFNSLHLKKLMATCYAESKIAGEQLSLLEPASGHRKKAYKIVINEVDDYNGDGAVDLADVEWLLQNDKNVLTELKGSGSYDSPECVELLKEADIVVTNPPFSKLEQFIPFLFSYNKKFLIIGNLIGIGYKEVFPFFREGKMWMGRSIHSGDRWFRVPDDYPLKAASSKIEDGKKYIKVKGVRWFTNLDYKERHEDLDLYKKYTPEEYPKYDNFDAIDVSGAKEIPKDYDGLMGVPITILDFLNPAQFEVLGLGSGNLAKEIGVQKNYRGRTDLAITKDGKHKCPFTRLIIRRKK